MTTTSRDDAPLLALDGMEKHFGATEALAGVTLNVRPGTVHALLGENGAGKTTLMRIAYGLLHADAGIVRWRGRVVRIDSPRDALRRGIGMVQQHFSLVPALTVAENVALGGRGLFDRRDAEGRVKELAESTGLRVDERATVADLPVGAQQRVEILKALARGVQLLVLDEPTATLAPEEAAALLRWARGFASGERAVVLITHKLRDALGVADEVTVLRRGRNVLNVPTTALTERSLAEAMLGASEERHTPLMAPVTSNDGAVVARLDDVWVEIGAGTAALRGASIDVRGGEIVGIAAVEGNGERELMRVLAGRERPSRGVAQLPSQVAYIPQDRHADALADDLTLAENVALAGAGRRRGWIDWSEIRARTAMLIERYDVRAAGPQARAATLSGGNQQRLVLARELDPDPGLVVADQPTRGLDLRATAEVHARLRAARASGSGVVVHSADLDEVIALADRVIVVTRGCVREVSGGRDTIGRAMLDAGG